MRLLYAEERTMSKTVAIVDDEADIRRSCEMILARLGHKIALCAEDPDKLVEAIRMKEDTAGVTHCDLILMDYHFPGKNTNGLQAAKEIKTLLPRTETVIISGDDSVRDSVIEAGFKFVAKPFSVSALSSILNGQTGK